MARAWVPVDENERPGEVLVYVTIVYGGQVVPLQTTGLIVGTEPEEEETPPEEPPGQQEQ